MLRLNLTQMVILGSILVLLSLPLPCRNIEQLASTITPQSLPGLLCLPGAGLRFSCSGEGVPIPLPSRSARIKI